MHANWKPVVEGPLADEAWDAVTSIAEGVLAHPLVADPSPPVDTSPSGGLSGVALFLTYLAIATEDQTLADVVDRLLGRCIHSLDGEPEGGPYLMGGWVGTSWAVHHITRQFGETLASDSGSDRMLLALTHRDPHQHTYDLMAGLVGYAIHALDRLPGSTARETLERIAVHFHTLHSQAKGGVVWRTEPSMMFEIERERHQGGYYNLGLAHGSPGIVGVLGAMVHHGIRPDLTEPLLEGGVEWFRRNVAERPVPAFTSDLDDLRGSVHLAWCYGEPGVASALRVAAQAADDQGWLDYAAARAHKVAPLVEHSGIKDASLCHGSAGLLAMFLRFHHATGDAGFADASRAWLQHLLRHRRSGEAIAGFPARTTGDDGGTEWREDPSFLVGAAGVGLALLAAITDIEPEWDRCLLLSTASG